MSATYNKSHRNEERQPHSPCIHAETTKLSSHAMGKKEKKVRKRELKKRIDLGLRLLWY